VGSDLGLRPTVEVADAAPADDLQHGYPPPRMRAGTATTAYCGAPMVVAGVYTPAPPDDACPMCAAIWAVRRGDRPPG
jgi:hypothetical protein